MMITPFFLPFLPQFNKFFVLFCTIHLFCCTVNLLSFFFLLMPQVPSHPRRSLSRMDSTLTFDTHTVAATTNYDIVSKLSGPYLLLPS